MNILLSSVGRRSYMVNYFKDALKGIGLLHAANSTETYAMQLADKSIITPLIYDDSYVDFLLNYSKENDITAIISLFDIDLLILAKNKNKFSEIGVKLVISDYDTIQLCNDKWLTYKFLIDNEFYAPQTYLDIDKFNEALKAGIIQFPVIIKPRWGMGSIGIHQADNLNEFEVLYLKTERSIFESYLKYESNIDPNKSILIQEKLNGFEYGIDVLNDLKGNLLACVPKIKLAMRAGETDSAEIINNQDLQNVGEALSIKLKHIANLDVDCFFINNRFYILELNCRFGGQYPFSHLAGVNFPKAIVQMLLNKPIKANLLKVSFGTIGIKDLVPVKLK